MKILVKLPTKLRKEQFFNTLDKFYSQCDDINKTNLRLRYLCQYIYDLFNISCNVYFLLFGHLANVLFLTPYIDLIITKYLHLSQHSL